MAEFKPSNKQFKALMYLGAIPIQEETNDWWKPLYNDKWYPVYDTTTTALGYWGAAWWGKSYLWCRWILMMASKFPWTPWFICRAELKRLKQSTLVTMFKVFKEDGIKDKRKAWVDYQWMRYEYREIEGKITLWNESVIYLVGLDHQPWDPEYLRFGSVEYTGGFFDEANEVPHSGYEILVSRIRASLEDFCPHCASRVHDEDFIEEERIKNPNPANKDDERVEKNLYECGICWAEHYWITPKTLCTFNPDMSRTREKFYVPWRDEEEQGWDTKFIPALVTDNPFIPKAYITNLRRMKDKVKRQRLLHGNFDYDDSPWKLLEHDDIVEMFNRETEDQKLAKKYKSDPEYRKLFSQLGKCQDTWYEYKITCDVARHGRDLAIIFVWNKLSIVEIWIYTYSDIGELEDRIKILAQKYKTNNLDVMVDEEWVWWWLVDALGCRWFISNSSAIQPKSSKKDPLKKLNYYRLRDQCWFELQDNIKDIAIDLSNIYVIWDRVSGKTGKVVDLSEEKIKQRIIDELDVMVEIDIDKDWPKRVIGKEAIKKKIWRSPDFWDNFMFRMFWFVKRSKKVYVYSPE